MLFTDSVGNQFLDNLLNTALRLTGILVTLAWMEFMESSTSTMRASGEFNCQVTFNRPTILYKAFANIIIYLYPRPYSLFKHYPASCCNSCFRATESGSTEVFCPLYHHWWCDKRYGPFYRCNCLCLWTTSFCHHYRSRRRWFFRHAQVGRWQYVT